MKKEDVKLKDVFQFVEETKNPFALESKLRAHGEATAKEQGFDSKEEIDAFLHTYSAAVITKVYGSGFWGEAITRSGGILVEIGGVGRNVFNFLMGNNYESTDIVIDKGLQDLLNNEAGIEIGKTATSEQDIIDKVTQKVRQREVVVDPAISREKFEEFLGMDIPDSFLSGGDSLSELGGSAGDDLLGAAGSGGVGGFFSRVLGTSFQRISSLNPVSFLGSMIRNRQNIPAGIVSEIIAQSPGMMVKHISTPS